MTALLRIIKPGMLTTVQDLGRWGAQSQGVPVAGAMDPLSHRIANALAGNSPREATLEITLVGPEIEFLDERTIAVVGAEFELWLDGNAVAATPIVVGAGSRLRFGARRRGARAYLAIGGGVDVPPVLNSRATHLVSRMGGVGGRALVAGDELPIGPQPERAQRGALPARRDAIGHASPATIRVLAGPQQDRFVADALDVLQSDDYTVGFDSDRMGFRLRGPALRHSRGADIISDATPLGALQVPESGQPLLLMADRQTTGGYPKIATVIAADIPAAGQLGPGDSIRFAACSRKEALAALIAQERSLLALESSVRS